MTYKDAETKDIGRRCNKCIDKNKPGGLGETRNDSSINGYEEQSRSIASNRTGRNSSRTNFNYGDAPFGKILQRLEKLEENHYRYVHAHQDRLRARLDESEKLEDEFRKEASELRSEILALAEAEQSELSE